jgi:excisionase family DNA binding protein
MSMPETLEPADPAEADADLLDAAGAAKLLSVPKSWVMTEARRDRIPHMRLGRYYRFDRHELREWALQRQRGPAHGRR